jgi:hypothetical protein
MNHTGPTTQTAHPPPEQADKTRGTRAGSPAVDEPAPAGGTVRVTERS